MASASTAHIPPLGDCCPYSPVAVLTELYDRTGDLRLVQDVAGHTTSRMTERYTHVHPVAVARAMGAIEEG
jgi:integrase